MRISPLEQVSLQLWAADRGAFHPNPKTSPTQAAGDAFTERSCFPREAGFLSASSLSSPDTLYANQISLLLAPAVLQRVGGGEERGRGGKEGGRGWSLVRYQLLRRAEQRQD